MLAGAAGAGALAIVGIAGWYSGGTNRPVTSPSEYVQITDFSDSVSGPAISPDGRMVTFFRGGNPFNSTEPIFVKVLPDGQSMQITDDGRQKYSGVYA